MAWLWWLSVVESDVPHRLVGRVGGVTYFRGMPSSPPPSGMVESYPRDVGLLSCSPILLALQMSRS